MERGADNARRTRVYIDGYNLYYGCQYTPAIIGPIAPIRPDRDNVNVELETHADWVRKHILDDEFAQSQLPALVPAADRDIQYRCRRRH
jgi:hypothetical protein